MQGRHEVAWDVRERPIVGCNSTMQGHTVSLGDGHPIGGWNNPLNTEKRRRCTDHKILDVARKY